MSTSDRRGYHRTRPVDLEAVSFQMGGHQFETAHRDLWVVSAGYERIARLKVTRAASSRSAQDGYPSELVLRAGNGVRPPDNADLALTAAFWLEWRDTADAARFPAVGLGHYELQIERSQLQVASP